MNQRVFAFGCLLGLFIITFFVFCNDLVTCLVVQWMEVDQFQRASWGQQWRSVSCFSLSRECLSRFSTNKIGDTPETGLRNPGTWSIPPESGSGMKSPAPRRGSDHGLPQGVGGVQSGHHGEGMDDWHPKKGGFHTPLDGLVHGKSYL
jgi:hypothetical protein